MEVQPQSSGYVLWATSLKRFGCMGEVSREQRVLGKEIVDPSKIISND